MKKSEITIDVSVEDLEHGEDGALMPVFKEVFRSWVGDNLERYEHPRCGTAYVTNKDGLGELTIVFRFPLDLEKIGEQIWRKSSPCNVRLEELAGTTVSDVDPLVIEQPKDLEDCFRILKNMGSSENLEEFKQHDPVEYHHGLGRLLRNEWGLWYDPSGDRPETLIHRYMVELGLEHADDMSSLILTSFQRHLKGEPLKIEEQVAAHKKYWAELEK